MSTHIRKWTKERVRYILRKLDEKTGLNGSELSISFIRSKNTLGYYKVSSTNEKEFGLNIDFFNKPETTESEVIDTIRHEYAHYYADSADLKEYISYSSRESHHGNHWKWACRMVGASPTIHHNSSLYADSKKSPFNYMDAIRAKDILEFDILSYLNKWHSIPSDRELTKKALVDIKRIHPNNFYEVGDRIRHYERGSGVVIDTSLYGYTVQYVHVRFDDHTEGVFDSMTLNKVLSKTK